jgi:hypothetical protein
MFPHGTHEGVVTAPLSCSPQVKASTVSANTQTPHFSLQKIEQFICTYATQRHQIPAQLACVSQSRYLWITNASNKHNTKALYFDAANASHYGKYLNDMWNAHANNCEIQWHPATLQG